ncbi:MAG: hypothetical protein QOG17_510 [Gammaproteobacteria bacterium]|nr:hypothetical protein [Gammaproteobacteria bacterium]
MFVPVSGAFGMGEYARSLAIAQGAQGRWPGAAIQFILSRQAPYAATAPYPATLLAASPTFHSAEVIEVMKNWRPDVVIFDNAGRTAQLRAARRLGTRVIYISARRRQRNKAFRLRWMRLIDEHWIAYPKFIAGDLGLVERLKLKFMRRPAVRYLDVILARGYGAGPGSERDGLLARMGLALDGYVLVVPGGGTGHPGAGDAVEQFLHAARELAAAGIAAVFVGRPRLAPADAGAPAAGALLRMLDPLPQPDLAELMRGARLIIANGGSTLLQSIACGRPCLAVPIAGDQGERIRRCVSAGVAVAAPLDSASIYRAAMELLRNEGNLGALAARTLALGLADGVDVALRAMCTLIEAK